MSITAIFLIEETIEIEIEVAAEIEMVATAIVPIEETIEIVVEVKIRAHC